MALHLYELLEGQIIALIEALDALHLSNEYELHQLITAQPDFLVRVAHEHDVFKDKLKDNVKVIYFIAYLFCALLTM